MQDMCRIKRPISTMISSHDKKKHNAIVTVMLSE